MGELGVVIFFVLSGFLITYLLLAEKKEYNTIDVRKFYLRRILRIWPLYFLILSTSLTVLFIVPALQLSNDLTSTSITLPVILLYILSYRILL